MDPAAAPDQLPTRYLPPHLAADVMAINENIAEVWDNTNQPTMYFCRTIIRRCMNLSRYLLENKHWVFIAGAVFGVVSVYVLKGIIVAAEYSCHRLPICQSMLFPEPGFNVEEYKDWNYATWPFIMAGRLILRAADVVAWAWKSLKSVF